MRHELEIFKQQTVIRETVLRIIGTLIVRKEYRAARLVSAQGVECNAITYADYKVVEVEEDKADYPGEHTD